MGRWTESDYLKLKKLYTSGIEDITLSDGSRQKIRSQAHLDLLLEEAESELGIQNTPKARTPNVSVGSYRRD